MRLGVLSDTHNDLSNLRAALQVFRAEGIPRLIHCGDLTGPELAMELAGFEVTYLVGNMDAHRGSIAAALRQANPANRIRDTFTGEVGGVPVAATHGHHSGAVENLAHSGLYAWVFHGHTHRRRNEIVGSTRIINPGALGGLKPEYRSACVVDLVKAEARFVRVGE